MALWLALELLVVVKGQPVQHSMLLFVHCGHRALLVDLTNVNLLFAFQDGAPPVFAHLTQVDLGMRQKQESGQRRMTEERQGCDPKKVNPGLSTTEVNEASGHKLLLLPGLCYIIPPLFSIWRIFLCFQEAGVLQS